MQRWLSMVSAILLASCATGSKQQEEEPTLTGHQEPYTFHRALGETLLRTGQYSRAVPHLRRMIESKPEAPEGHCLMGQALLGLEFYGEAEQELKQALRLDKKRASAYAMLGVLYDTQRRHREAERAHRQAIALAPRSPGNYNNLGFCLYLQGRYPEAIAAYEKALQLRPAVRRVHNNVGFAQARSGHADLALKHFRLGGDEVQAQNNLGLAYELMGKPEQAYLCYVKALSLSEAFPRIRENLERVCKKLGRPVPSVLTINKAELDKGTNP